MAESEEELKSMLMKVKEESEKAWLKLNIKKPISWHSIPSFHGKQMGKQQKHESFLSWVPKSLWTVTAAMKSKDACFLEGKLINCILKSRDITLSTKVCVVKATVFPVVMYGCESWTRRRLSAEELMLLNCGATEDSRESLGLQGDQTGQY